jgi:predicted O-methyltransferase YrrM
VLWSGKVTAPYEAANKDTRMVQNMNQKLHEDPRVENLLFPIRDGLMIVRKKLVVNEMILIN